jgi:ATP-dependent DNA helicase RecG
MDINELLISPEGKTLEFKRDLSSPMGILRTVVSFSNTAGGVIILGVEDKTKYICGVEEPLKLEEKLSNLISDCITPQIIPEIEVFPWRETYLIITHIFPSSARPHYLKNQGVEKGCYIRVGSTNRLADKVMLSELQRVRIEDSFDKASITELNSEDIDFRVISELFLHKKEIRKSDLETMDLIAAYQKKKVPTIGGIILFGKNRLKYFPDAWIQLGRFRGTTKVNIIDTQEVTSYPILAIDEVMLFVKKHAMNEVIMPGSGSKNESLSRHKSSWSIPLIAIREAIVNAVVHADYAQQGSPIRLAIFDNRVEIENPGLLLFGLTVDEIKRGISKLRNRVIGQIFYRLGLIERWGSGIRRIIDSCKEAGFSEPIFEEIGTHFRVTIFTEVVEEPHFNETDRSIIVVLKKNDGLSTKEISELISKSQRATRLRLINLIEKGLVVEVGTGPNDPKRKYFIKGGTSD